MTNMYEDNQTEHDRHRTESVAKLYNPDVAAEYDRIRRDVPDNRISPSQRLAMGYSDTARDAATELDK